MTLYSKNVSITKKKMQNVQVIVFLCLNTVLRRCIVDSRKRSNQIYLITLACIRYECQATLNSNVQWKNSIQRNIINFRNGFPNESF